MSTPAPVRCSLASRDVDESAAGTASTVRAFVLLECAGPWGVDAVRDSRLPDEAKDWLRALTRSGVRPLLVRRPRDRGATGVRLFAAATAAPGPTTGTPEGRPAALWSTALDDVRDVCSLDLTGLRQRRVPPALTPDDQPLFLVCTHGRHDACCAEWGRPLAAAMRTAAPDLVWEVSHIGGDRFAPNVLVLPEGLYYGRVEPTAAATFVADHRDSLLDLDHLRGRSAYPFAVQAAEIGLRRHLGDRRVAAYDLVGHDRTERGDGAVLTTAVFDVDGTRWEVHVQTRSGPPRRLTCRAVREDAPPVHTLVGVTSV